MKKNSSKCLFLMGLLLSSLTFAQTPKQIERIKQETNVSKLNQIADVARAQAVQEKETAWALAAQNGWQTQYIDAEGNYLELKSVSPQGEPIYFKTESNKVNSEVPLIFSNVAVALSTRANWLHNGGGLGLNIEGQNMIAHVWDGGIARATHQEYDGVGGENRVSIGDGGGLNFHAAHVMGTVVASGFVPDAKGMAPQAQGRAFDWNSDEAEMAVAATNGMLISNHSYTFVPLSNVAGAYLDITRRVDEITYNAPYYLPVFSAGNNGNNNFENTNPLEGNPLFDKLTGRKTSKNSMVVANAQDAVIDADGNLVSVVINGSSSEGPTDDFRIKPDITGNGTALFSTYETADDAYNTISGTSMSSPNVTGSLLLLQQHMSERNGNFMKSATLKGLALHTADDVNGSAGLEGPDAVYGWGLMNTKRAAETIRDEGLYSYMQELTINDGETLTFTVRSDDVNDLLASISWTDRPGEVQSDVNDNTPHLVNDLDITVSNATETFMPWRMDGVNSNSKGDNLVDPFERVDVASASGEYTITVSHKGSLVGGSQDFSLIVTGIVSDFSFTSSDFNKVGCSDEDIVFDFDYVQTVTGTTNFSVENLPAGATASFSPSQISADGTLSVTISNLSNVPRGNYELVVTGDNGNETESRTIYLEIYQASFEATPIVLSSPSNGQNGVPTTMTFQWEDNANAESYYMEISDSPSFDNIVASGTDTDLDLVIEGLENNKVYYWRAQPINRCGTGDFSETYSFQTVIAEDCSATYTATDFSNAGIALSAGAQASVPVEVPDNLTISRLIVDVDITHQAVSHLTLFVQQPSGLGGARTTLLDQACDDADDFDVVFDDEGGTLVCSPDSPAVAGTIAPVESLRGSAGLNANGTWLFGVTDNVPTRGGIIDAASITVCSPVSNTNVPGFTNNSVAVVANDTYVFQTSDIEATTASETADQQVYTIVTTPEFGDILKSGTPLAVGGTFTQEDIDLGNISFSNIQTAVFTDSFKVDIVNGAGGWLPNQEINLTANTVSAESFELSNLMVYPNPTEGMIFVKFPTLEASNVKIDLFDLRGRRIFSEDFSVDQNLFKESISVGGISNGVYLIKVSNGNYSTTKRIIVQK